MLVRILTANDAATYREVRLNGLRESPTAFGSSYDEEVMRTLDEIAKRIAPPSGGRYAFGAFEGEELVGVLGLARLNAAKNHHCTEIWGMYVLPEYRQRGIGGALMETAISYARSLDGVRQIKLTVTATNTPARRLYETMGFKLFGVEPEALLVGDKYYDEEYYILRIDGPG